MNRIIKGLGIALGCVLIASSCSEISFGDKFLGDQPESSGATTEENVLFENKCRKGADQSIYRITLWATDRL